MKHNRLKETLLLAIGIIVIFSAITFGIQYADNQRAKTVESSTEKVESSSISLSIDGLYTNELISTEENESILQLLERVDTTNPDIKLVSKSYGEMGTLVESMGDHTNGTDSKYWQYTVNGTAPMIGADEYLLEAGDSVEWMFKQSEF